GERRALALPSADRVRVEPLGAAAIEALDDGRALALDDLGSVWASTDGGAHWVDVTSQVRAPVSRLALLAGELWLVDTNGGALRLERDGRLASFDHAPEAPSAAARPKDPRWRGDESPLRVAFTRGAALDERTALVLEAGDVYRVDVRTGEILSVV